MTRPPLRGSGPLTYDLDLAERIRDALAQTPDVTERRMFGGLSFLIHGNMAVVASAQGGLMVRVGPDQADDLVETTPADYAEMGGRRMKAFLRIASADVSSDEDLAAWIERGNAFVSTLPPK